MVDILQNESSGIGIEKANENEGATFFVFHQRLHSRFSSTNQTIRAGRTARSDRDMRSL
jgi:hypothetical protein